MLEVTNYSTKDVAKMTGRTVETVRLWINDGKLNARKHPGGRDFIISKDDFERFMAGGCAANSHKPSSHASRKRGA